MSTSISEQQLVKLCFVLKDGKQVEDASEDMQMAYSVSTYCDNWAWWLQVLIGVLSYSRHGITASRIWSAGWTRVNVYDCERISSPKSTSSCLNSSPEQLTRTSGSRVPFWLDPGVWSAAFWTMRRFPWESIRCWRRPWDLTICSCGGKERNQPDGAPYVPCIPSDNLLQVNLRSCSRNPENFRHSSEVPLVSPPKFI